MSELASAEVEELKPPPLGKDELNLAEFPIALLTEKAPHGVKTLVFKDQIFDQGKRKLLNRKLTIEGSESYGLPTAKDDEVILALIQLSKRRNFHQKKLEFTRYELIATLGWSNTGQSYTRIELALRRWVSVTLHYENAWWDSSEERWTSGAFHIIDEFELNDSRETTSQMTLLTSRIIWSNRVFDNFVEGHLKNIRYDIYVKLRSSISKRMYRFLDKRFYHNRTTSFDLRDFAYEHIGLSRSYKDCGKLKEKLAVAISELEDIGFIERASREQRYQQEGRGRWRISFTHKQKKPIPAAACIPQANDLELPHLATELISRGVTEETAAELVKHYPAETIQEKIDVLDWLVEKQDKRIAKSPAGYLVKSITTRPNGYKAPAGYINRVERDRQAEAKRQAERQEIEARQKKANEEARQTKAEAYIKGLSPVERMALEAEILAQASPEARESYESPGLARYRDTLMLGMVREHVGRLLARQESATTDA